MSKITRLPPDLANQIAAGEVVERPASVVKELIENAIDARASRISIHIEFGGKKQVRVEDDGEGMDPEDARLAIERHATSKIRRADDLAAIVTLGFRGEALPSIASVSHFLLRTRTRATTHGTEVRVNGGLVSSVSEAAAVEGTVIEVSDLFYNLPARRKFLKSDAAESAQVSRVVTQIALAYPEIGFTLTSSGRTLVRCPPAETRGARLYQLYGERPDLVEVAREAGGIKITGYIAALAEQAPSRGVQHIFINRRIVKDRTIAHAILDAYSAASIKERSPEVHLFLEMAPDTVDVNVHPTKAEVRFRHQSLVHEVVRRAVIDALGQGEAPQLHLGGEVHAPAPVTSPLPELFRNAATFPSRWSTGNPVPSSVSVMPLQAGTAAVPGQAPAASRETQSGVSAVRPMIALGQFRDTFIIAIDDEGIAIIDQHVAHERVLFERVMERLSSGRLESQRLLVPMLIELPPGSREALLVRRDQTEQLGFEIEEFGDATLKVTAVPGLLGAGDAQKALRALAEDLEGLDRGSHVHEALRRIAATTACHAAVKAHDRLTAEKMAHILDELRATAHSTVCPHGRPVMLRLTRREIEKNFERI
jgi:DNA mismatch repair protein MutL